MRITTVEDADTLLADGGMDVDIRKDADDAGPAPSYTDSANLGTSDLRHKLRPGAVRGRGWGNRARSPSPAFQRNPGFNATATKRFGRGRGIRR